MGREAGKTPELRWASDRALRVAFGETASDEAHARVRALARALEAEALPGVVDFHPAYASVLVVVDPLAAPAESVESRIDALARGLHIEALPAPRLVEIPVAYGGEHGPDVDDVARMTGLSGDDVVERHAAVEYRVAFLGFVPGFAYLSGLPSALRVPRLPAPRRRVPAGSLGIAGGQTAIYPLATPGGWRLIGRTPWALFRADREPPALLSVGDRVRFVPIEDDAFDDLEREART